MKSTMSQQEAIQDLLDEGMSLEDILGRAPSDSEKAMYIPVKSNKISREQVIQELREEGLTDEEIFGKQKSKDSGWKRKAGLTGRVLAAGAGMMADLPALATNAGIEAGNYAKYLGGLASGGRYQPSYSTAFEMPSEQARRLYDEATGGKYIPETMGERVLSTIGEVGTSLVSPSAMLARAPKVAQAGVTALGKLSERAYPLARQILQFQGVGSVPEAAAVAAGTGTSAALQDLGANPYLAALASFPAGVVGGAAAHIPNYKNFQGLSKPLNMLFGVTPEKIAALEAAGVEPRVATAGGDISNILGYKGLPQTLGGAGVMKRAALEDVAALQNRAGDIASVSAPEFQQVPHPLYENQMMTQPLLDSTGQQIMRRIPGGFETATQAGKKTKESISALEAKESLKKSAMYDKAYNKLNMQDTINLEPFQTALQKITKGTSLDKLPDSILPSELKSEIDYLLQQKYLTDAYGMTRVKKGGGLEDARHFESFLKELGRDKKTYSNLQMKTINSLLKPIWNEIRITAERQNPKAYQDLKAADTYTKETAPFWDRKRNDALGLQILEAKPEEIPNLVLGQKKLGGTTIESLRQKVGEMPELASYTINTMGLNQSGEFSPSIFFKSWSEKQLSREAKEALFPKNQIKDIDAVARASELMRNAERLANTSQTAGAQEAMRWVTGGALAGAGYTAGRTLPLYGRIALTVLSAGSPYFLARFMASPSKARWLARATQIKNPANMDSHVRTLGKMIQQNPRDEKELRQYKADLERRLQQQYGGQNANY